MIRATRSIQTETYTDKRTFVNRFNRLVSGLGAQVATDMASKVDKRLNREPGPVRYPIEWTRSPQPADRPPNMPDGTYSKQKAAFFASDGFGRGIPTRRTGKVRAWKLLWKSTGDGKGTWSLGNRVPYTRFIYGGFAPRTRRARQKFHANTGWPNAAEEAPPIFDETMSLFAKRFDESVGAFGEIVTDKV